MWKPVSYSSFVQWDVLRYPGLREKAWITGNCQCGVNVNAHVIWKEQNVFSRARVCHSATVFLRLPGARRRQQQLFLSYCWSEYGNPQAEDSAFAFFFLHRCRGPQAGSRPWLWARAASSPAAPCGSFFRPGRLRPRPAPHHPLLGCLSPAKINILAEKSSNASHFLYPLQDEEHPSILPIPCIISF